MIFSIGVINIYRNDKPLNRFVGHAEDAVDCELMKMKSKKLRRVGR